MFKSVRERDIDFLLLEELAASTVFRSWFLKELGCQIDTITEFIRAWHSVSDSELGESDLEFGVIVGDGRALLVMIENKIDATFQDNQLARYQKRGENATNHRWDEFCTCLVAPETYLTSTEKTNLVDGTVSYEAIQDRFLTRESDRARFKAEMLAEAIEQNRRGYNREPDDQVTELHRFYWTIARDDYPRLGMEKSMGVPSGNLWVRFKPPSLPTDGQLIHKMGRGNVDLQLSLPAEQRDDFLEQCRSLLEDDMDVVKTGKSLSIRITTPPISTDKEPTTQQTQIQTGLEAANRLLDWYTTDYRTRQSELE